MKINKDKVKKILVINLSNIGDAILTTPVIQTLRNNFPQAHLAVLIGPRALSVFKDDPRVEQTIIYDKADSGKNKLNLVQRLRLNRYDLVVDLRNTAFSIFLGARYSSSVFAQAPKSLTHMKERHLWKLNSLGLNINYSLGPSFMFNKDEQNQINQMLNKWQLQEGQIVAAIAPGARNLTKCWEKEGYRKLIVSLVKEYQAKIIMVGDEHDQLLVQEIISQIKPEPFNTCGKTSLGELAFLLTKCSLLISNDSACMHLAWAVGTPVVAIFGPTDYKKYAPGGPSDIVIRKDIACAACEQSLCPRGTRECMTLISAEEVFAACKRILDKNVAATDG